MKAKYEFDLVKLQEDLRYKFYVVDEYSSAFAAEEAIGVGKFIAGKVMKAEFTPKIYDLILICEYIGKSPSEYFKESDTLVEDETQEKSKPQIPIIW